MLVNKKIYIYNQILTDIVCLDLTIPCLQVL